MGNAHYLPYGEQLVMGSWRRAERLIRCEINRFSLRRGRSALHNIGGPPPYGTPNEKPKPLTSLFCRISAEAIFDRQGSGSLRYGQFVMGSIARRISVRP